MAKGRARLALLLMTAGLLVPAGSRAAASDFVTASGAQLMVNGVPWAAVGPNIWDMDPAKAVAGDPAACGHRRADIDAYLDRTLAKIKSTMHATAVRAFGFGMAFTAGGRDWSTTDKLLYYAAKHDIRVIPVLGDQYATCGTPAKDAAWYRGGYGQPDPVWGVDYKSYAVSVATRYANDPTVAFWQLMNEADPTRAGSPADPGALRLFAAEMAGAIRAVDANHLINLGTVGNGSLGNRMPEWATLVDCPGGCTDIAENHVYNQTDPLPGSPLQSSVQSFTNVWNASERAEQGMGAPAIDGWSGMSAGVPSQSGRGNAYTSWGFRFTRTDTRNAFSVYLDNVRASTMGLPALYSFESSTDGFTSPHATLTTTPVVSTDGARSLQIDVPAGVGLVDVIGPALPGALTNVAVDLRMSFAAPSPDNSSTLAGNLHATTVTRRKPFFVGEAGIQAAIPALTRCASHPSTQTRANRFAAMAAAVVARGASGFLVWDWKDPAEPAINANGTEVVDQTIDCWSLTPGDPAVDALRALADRYVVPAVPDRPALGADRDVLVVFPTPARANVGTDVMIRGRLTRGGDGLHEAHVRSSGGCNGGGLTDAFGVFTFACHISAAGTQPLTISVEPASCGGCSITPQAFPLETRHAVTVTATSGVVERGTPAPVTVTLTGQGLDGLSWTLSACGSSGTIASAGTAAIVTTACANDAWTGVQKLKFSTPGSATVWPAELTFNAMAFERIYRDPATGDCIGLDLTTQAWVGGSKRQGDCARNPSWASNWFSSSVIAAERPTSFVATPAGVAVNVRTIDGRRIIGHFSTDASRAFVAVIQSAESTRPLRSV